MICNCFENIVHMLGTVGIKSAKIRYTDVNELTGDESMIIPVEAVEMRFGIFPKKVVVGVIGEYCPFCGEKIEHGVEVEEEESIV